MKLTRLPKPALLALAIVVIVGGLLAAAGSSPASAGLGNSGVPVRCFKPGPSIAPGGAAFLNCVAADGTSFAEGQRVPTGYYLAVTDVLVTPDAGNATTGITDVTVYDAYGTNSRQSSFRLRDTTASSFGFKWFAPYLVLTAGHRLEITNANISAFSAEVRISGVLVTNLSSLPLVLGGS